MPFIVSVGFFEIFDQDFTPSFGTHFYQDVMDADMISGSLEARKAEINYKFIYK